MIKNEHIRALTLIRITDEMRKSPISQQWWGRPDEWHDAIMRLLELGLIETAHTRDHNAYRIIEVEDE